MGWYSEISNGGPPNSALLVHVVCGSILSTGGSKILIFDSSDRLPVSLSNAFPIGWSWIGSATVAVALDVDVRAGLGWSVVHSVSRSVSSPQCFGQREMKFSSCTPLLLIL